MLADLGYVALGDAASQCFMAGLLRLSQVLNRSILLSTFATLS